MASEQTGRDVVDQLQEIRSEVAQVKGLSTFAARLHISDAKNRGIDLVEGILEIFNPTKAKVYLLVDGFRSSATIGKIVNIKQPTAYGHLMSLKKKHLIDHENPGSSKATFRKSSIEDVIGLSNLLKKKFDLSGWLDEVAIQENG